MKRLGKCGGFVGTKGTTYKYGTVNSVSRTTCPFFNTRADLSNLPSSQSVQYAIALFLTSPAALATRSVPGSTISAAPLTSHPPPAQHHLLSNYNTRLPRPTTTPDNHARLPRPTSTPDTTPDVHRPALPTTTVQPSLSTMRYLLLLAACTASSASAMSPSDALYPPTCRMLNERCVGAADMPFVVWRPCCRDYVCGGPDLSAGGYGLVCIPPTCRAEGDRCRGADGYPQVDWIPCCEGMTCGGVHGDGWGEKCSSPSPGEAMAEVQAQMQTGKVQAGEVPAMAMEKVPNVQMGEALPTEAPAMKVDMSKMPKCWANGERCGDSLRQPWEDVKCCSGACDEPASDYGMQCSDGKKSLAARACAPAGGQCRSVADCCGGFACEHMGDTFMVCVEPGKCAGLDALCGKDEDCCGKASCGDGKGDGKGRRCKVADE